MPDKKARNGLIHFYSIYIEYIFKANSIEQKERCWGITYFVEGYDEEGTATGGLENHRQKLGVNRTEVGIPWVLRDPDVVITLFLLEGLSEHVTEPTRPYNAFGHVGRANCWSQRVIEDRNHALQWQNLPIACGGCDGYNRQLSPSVSQSVSRLSRCLLSAALVRAGESATDRCDRWLQWLTIDLTQSESVFSVWLNSPLIECEFASSLRMRCTALLLRQCSQALLSGSALTLLSYTQRSQQSERAATDRHPPDWSQLIQLLQLKSTYGFDHTISVTHEAREESVATNGSNDLNELTVTWLLITMVVSTGWTNVAMV